MPNIQFYLTDDDYAIAMAKAKALGFTSEHTYAKAVYKLGKDVVTDEQLAADKEERWKKRMGKRTSPRL